MTLPLLAIPASPGKFVLDAGPFQVRWYGFLIALGVLIAIWTRGARCAARLRPGAGVPHRRLDRPGGIIGARVYHVITDWSASRATSARRQDLGGRPRHARASSSAAPSGRRSGRGGRAAGAL